MDTYRIDIAGQLGVFDSPHWCQRSVDGDGTVHRWLPVIEYSALRNGSVHRYGLLDTGAWHADYADQKRVMPESSAYGFFALLETPFREIVTIIRDSVERVGLPDHITATFPLDWIVENALAQGSYWASCAEQWLEEGYPPNEAIAGLLPRNRVITKWRNGRLNEIFRAEEADSKKG